MIAALFVCGPPRGVYTGLPDVDAWWLKPAKGARDARLYAGPWPVVAHSPCERWGRYWHGGPSAIERKRKGDDGGCFAAALHAVRTWGGVLEHPEASAAWEAFGLMKPPYDGGWVAADWEGGWTCRVEQGHYGHRARKGTWLYACRVHTLPSLRWGPSAATAKIDDGFHSAEERRAARRPPRGATSDGKECLERLTKHELLATPVAFRDALLSIARECVKVAA